MKLVNQNAYNEDPLWVVLEVSDPTIHFTTDDDFKEQFLIATVLSFSRMTISGKPVSKGTEYYINHLSRDTKINANATQWTHTFYDTLEELYAAHLKDML